jgi:prepilin peptidase CpaA
VLAVLVVFAALAILHRDQVEWLSHIGAFILVLGAGVFLYSIHQMGAGDAKLLAATALWSGGIYAMIALLFWVSLSGLAGMLIILLLRYLAPRFSKLTALPRVLQKKQPIPYGIGIGPGAIIASFSFPPWLWQQ